MLALLVAAIAVEQTVAAGVLPRRRRRLLDVIDLFLGFVLGPIIGSLSIPARVEFTTRLMPKMVLIMPTLVTVTLAAGWQLGDPARHRAVQLHLHGWIVASYIVVGVMAVIALGSARAREHRRADRAEEAAAQPGGDRAADEALHLHRRRHRADAGGDARDHDQAGRRMSERRLPPVTQLGMFSLALIVAGGIYLAAHIPRHVPLGPPIALLSRLGARARRAISRRSRASTDFAWGRFFVVSRWALLAYTIIAGLIGYAFVCDQPQRRPARRAAALARRVRGPRARPDRVHGRALRGPGSAGRDSGGLAARAPPDLRRAS